MSALSPVYLADITGLSVNVKDAMRSVEESLLAGIAPPSSAWASAMALTNDSYQAAVASIASAANIPAEQSSALNASGVLLTAEETMRQITGSASDDALRGLAFLLGKKPTG
jgi:hypothetical protein